VNVQDAAYHTVHDQPGGSESLGPRLGVSPVVLRGKVSPSDGRHHLMLAEADRLMGLTGDVRILHALAATHSHVCIRVDGEVPASDLAVLELVTHVWREHGDVGRAVDDLLADGRVLAPELARVKAEIYELQQALLAKLARLEGMAE
jgi:hypothetical protein